MDFGFLVHAWEIFFKHFVKVLFQILASLSNLWSALEKLKLSVRKIKLFDLIVRMRVVLETTIVGEEDWRFDALSGSHSSGSVGELFDSRMLWVWFEKTDWPALFCYKQARNVSQLRLVIFDPWVKFQDQQCWTQTYRQKRSQLLTKLYLSLFENTSRTSALKLSTSTYSKLFSFSLMVPRSIGVETRSK